MNKRRFALVFIVVSAASVAMSCDLFRPGKPQATTPQAVAQAASEQARAREPVGMSRNGIFLAYPRGSDVPAASSFLVGAVAPGSTLTANGQPVQVNHAGFFAHVIQLAVGDNQFVLVRNGDPAQSLSVTVRRPAPTPPIPADPLQIVKRSLEPSQEMGVEPGDFIQISMRGSPGAQASVRIGNRTINLVSGGAKASPNQGLDTAFGVTYQKSTAGPKDLYSGFYKVTAADDWQHECPEFSLTKDGTTIHEKSAGTITVIGQPYIATTLHDNTVVRVGPGAARTTQWPQGVRLLVDGQVGTSCRCDMSCGKHLWVEKQDLSENEGGGAPPTSLVRTINIENEGSSGARLTIPLTQRLPFELKQEITSGNRIQLKLYGATADTDWITEPSTSSKAAQESSQRIYSYPKAGDRSKNPVAFVTFQQLADRVYQATINLSIKQQWGYWAEYDGNNLVLHIKGAPSVALTPTSLKGLKICVDPGHGGNEPGSIGCSGIREATLNLAIGKKLQQILVDQGATVVMTRDSDVDVSLADRVKIACDQNCDLLLSVHNNALPDGRSPWTEHGTSSYYYHPQSLLFANSVRRGLVNRLAFPDYHTRWQNLALCRPSNMPAALAEVGFMINPDEYATLLSDAGQLRAAQGLAEGIHSFLNDAFAASNPKAVGGQPSTKTHKR